MGNIVIRNSQLAVCVQVAVNGSRGDFATPDSTNGTLLLTQTDSIMRLTPPAGGRFGQAPPAPLGLSASPGNTQVSLAWNPVAGATGYTLSRATSSSGPFLPVATGIAGTAWTDPGLTNGQTYFYVAVAANGFGTGPASNVASATPDGGLPAPTNAAAFVSQAVPAAMSAGQQYPVTLRNTGTSVWTAAGGYRLGSQAPQDNGTWGLGRVELPSPPGPVQPGATAAFTFNVTAPAAPNTYDFQWRMVQENVQWFGDFSPDVAVSVGPPPFQIVGVSDGDALTGDVMMTVAINDPTPDHSMTPDPLSLQIDGAEVSLGHVDLPSATSSAETITFDVHTPDYANGAHTITVTDNNTSSDTRTVTFANVIQNLSTSCMFDGGPFLVSATLDSPRPWQVLVKDAMGNPVKDIQGTGPAINVSWDGTDDQGNPIPQGYYVAMISAGDPVAAAAQGVKGFGLRPRQSIIYPDPIFPNPVERDFSKSTRGDVLIVLDQDVLNDPMTGQSNIVAYPAYIESKLGPHIGGDFENVPTFIEFSSKYTDPEILQEDTQEIQSILESSNLSFMYVHAHGEDYFKGWSGPAQQSVPFFEVGSNTFYSVHPTGNRKMQGSLRSEYVVADHINPSYDAGDFPPPFVWMDTCCSAGSDGHGDPPTSFLSLAPSGVFPDNSWADAFSIDDLDGGFLGWMGTVPAYGQISHNLPGPFGTPSLGRQADPASFDKFRIAIWEGMFTNKDYMNIPFDSAFANAFQAGGPASGNIFNVGVVRAADRGYYYGNPFLNFPSP